MTSARKSSFLNFFIIFIIFSTVSYPISAKNSCSSILIQPISCDAAITFSATTSNLLSGIYSYTYELSFEGAVVETLNSSLDSITFTTLVSDSCLTPTNGRSGYRFNGWSICR